MHIIYMTAQTCQLRCHIVNMTSKCLLIFLCLPLLVFINISTYMHTVFYNTKVVVSTHIFVYYAVIVIRVQEIDDFLQAVCILWTFECAHCNGNITRQEQLPLLARMRSSGQFRLGIGLARAYRTTFVPSFTYDQRVTSTTRHQRRTDVRE